MKFLVYKYYSGYCTYEVEASDEDQAYEMIKEMPPNHDEVSETLEEWEECNEVKVVTAN